MHLMSFLFIRRPSLFMRLMILGAQGVFFNLFFLTYIFCGLGFCLFTACTESTSQPRELAIASSTIWNRKRFIPVGLFRQLYRV